MANYYGKARSNYFAVKDAEAFTSEMAQYPIEVITRDAEDGTLYGFIDEDPDGGADIWCYWDEEADEQIDIEWAEVFKRHLQDGWVAILLESGAEKYRYVGGMASAFNNKGEEKTIMLNDIYELAQGLGENITRAEY